MYVGVQPLPVVAGVNSRMLMPQGTKPAMNRCRDSHATAACARGSRDSRYGNPMATPAPARNLRLENLDFIAVILLMVRSLVLHCASGRLVRNASLDAIMARNDRHWPPPLAIACADNSSA